MANESRRNTSTYAATRMLKKNRIPRLLDNVFVQFFAFACFVAAVVAILVGGVDDRDRQLDEAMIGQVSPFTIEATRDFSFSEKDDASSNRLRDEIARSVPAVYDWREGLGDELGDKVSRAFAAMRDALAEQARIHLAEQDPELLGQIVEHTASPITEERALVDSLDADHRRSLAFELRQDNFDQIVGLRLSESDFQRLATDGFSADAAEAAGALIASVMASLIVPSAREIEQESERGIYLRRLRNGDPLIEYHVTDLEDRFVGFDDATRQIEERAPNYMVGIYDQELRDAITALAIASIRPNTTHNEAMTLEKRQAARDSVAEQVVTEEFREGQVLVDQGHIVSERDFRIIEEMLEGDETYHATQVLSGVALFGLLLLIILYGFGRRNIRGFAPGPRDIVFMGTTLLVMLLITRVGTAVSHALAEPPATIPSEAWYFFIPVAAGGMLIKLVLDTRYAVLFTILFALFVGVIAGNSLFFVAYTIVGTLVGITTVQQVKNRMALMWSGVAVGGVNVAAIVAYLLLQGELFQMTSFAYVFLGLGGGIASGFFILAVLPVFESVFGYTTDIKLLELANLNQPLLRELIIRAPGSYHHSMMVGSLCEAAAEAIGANALLARVGSYYHDIGKGKNPQYFAENQKAGHNPHDKLKPNMSALIIKSHVKDGLDMARRHRLPEEIQDFIAQHHGTSLIAYFYHQAKQAEDPDIPEVVEKDFRYPGPKPQTRETAICLLADGVEAASRAMPNPSPARLKGLVQTMINRAFTDGQLDECDLTLKDLNKIARAFTRILSGIYHHRPEYPDEKKGKPREASRGKNNDTNRTGRRQKNSEALEGTDGRAEVDQKSDKNGEDKNARRGTGSGKGSKAPSDRQAERPDRATPREDLPRLGSD